MWAILWLSTGNQPRVYGLLPFMRCRTGRCLYRASLLRILTWAAAFFCSWTIFSPDGTLVGMITDTGPAGGGPGFPGGAAAAHLVTGGLTGFFGVIGEHRIRTITPARQASTAEDPANRRTLGGG